MSPCSSSNGCGIWSGTSATAGQVSSETSQALSGRSMRMTRGPDLIHLRHDARVSTDAPDDAGLDAVGDDVGDLTDQRRLRLELPPAGLRFVPPLFVPAPMALRRQRHRSVELLEEDREPAVRVRARQMVVR